MVVELPAVSVATTACVVVRVIMIVRMVMPMLIAHVQFRIR